jgi:hypothetical protein
VPYLIYLTITAQCSFSVHICSLVISHVRYRDLLSVCKVKEGFTLVGVYLEGTTLTCWERTVTPRKKNPGAVYRVSDLRVHIDNTLISFLQEIGSFIVLPKEWHETLCELWICTLYHLSPPCRWLLLSLDNSIANMVCNSFSKRNDNLLCLNSANIWPRKHLSNLDNIESY